MDVLRDTAATINILASVSIMDNHIEPPRSILDFLNATEAGDVERMRTMLISSPLLLNQGLTKVKYKWNAHNRINFTCRLE